MEEKALHRFSLACLASISEGVVHIRVAIMGDDFFCSTFFMQDTQEEIINVKTTLRLPRVIPRFDSFTLVSPVPIPTWYESSYELCIDRVAQGCILSRPKAPGMPKAISVERKQRMSVRSIST